MTRAVVDINRLDQLLREDIDKFDRAANFCVAVWRQDRDESGANWNAYLKRVREDRSSDIRWWQVVPRLRRAFNLDDGNE